MASFAVKKIFSVLKDWPSFFLSFVGLGVIAPSLPFWALVFYLFFVPRFLFELFQKRKTFGTRRFSLPLIFLVFCFFFVGVISCFWSVLGYQGWQWLIDFSCTLLFLWGALEAMRQVPKFFEKMMSIIAFGGSLNAIISFFLRLIGGNIDPYAPQRMAGFGIFHPIVFAGDFVGLSLLCLVFMLFYRRKEKKPFQKQDCLYGVLLCLNGFFLFLTGCRMAWVALFVALSMFLKWQKQVIILGGGAVLTCILFLNSAISHYFFERMDSGHFEIWQKTYAYFAPYSLFGKGVQMHMLVPNGKGGFFAHPHSFYLSLLIQGGFIGMAFFLLACATLLFFEKRDSKNSKIPAFALYPLLCGATDLSFVFKGPSEEWILIWLPLLMVFSAVLTEDANSGIAERRGGKPKIKMVRGETSFS